MHQSDNQKNGIFKSFKIFLCSKLGHESSLFKQGSPKKILISSSTQLGELPNFGLNAEEGLP